MSNTARRYISVFLQAGLLLIIWVASVSASPGNGSGVPTPDPFTEVLIDRM